MSLWRLFLAVALGGLISGGGLAIISYFLSLYRPVSSGSGNFISFSEPEILVAMAGFVSGLIIGSIMGIIVVGLQLNTPVTAISGFGIYLLLGILLVIVTGEIDKSMWLGCLTFAVVGTLTGIIVSLVNSVKTGID